MTATLYYCKNKTAFISDHLENTRQRVPLCICVFLMVARHQILSDSEEVGVTHRQETRRFPESYSLSPQLQCHLSVTEETSHNASTMFCADIKALLPEKVSLSFGVP